MQGNQFTVPTVMNLHDITNATSPLVHGAFNAHAME